MVTSTKYKSKYAEPSFLWAPSPWAHQSLRVCPVKSSEMHILLGLMIPSVRVILNPCCKIGKPVV